jgi:hypothetical protein
MKKSKGRYNLSQMRPIVEGYPDFTGTKKEYCARYDLNPYTFDYWRIRVKETDAVAKKKGKAPTHKTGFVAISAPVLSPTSNYIIHLPDGKRLELPDTTPVTVLSQLLQIQV